jgi:Ras GTPase-activating-like protein IQGAP2/3
MSAPSVALPYFLTSPQQNEVASHLEDATEMQEGSFPNDDKTQKYGNLMFMLQSEPRHIAHLCRLVSMAEIDSLLQTVMFTIYGNQYESREEHLLLTMFQVCGFGPKQRGIG